MNALLRRRHTFHRRLVDLFITTRLISFKNPRPIIVTCDFFQNVAVPESVNKSKFLKANIYFCFFVPGLYFFANKKHRIKLLHIWKILPERCETNLHSVTLNG